MRTTSTSTRIRVAAAAASLLAATALTGVATTGAQVPAAAGGRATNMVVVGRNDLGGGGLNGAVAVVGTTAIVGAGLVADPGSTHTERFNPFECLAFSVKVVDLSDPARPVVAATIPMAPGTAAIDVDAIRVETPRFTGDLAAVAFDDGPAHTAPTRCNPSPATTERGVAYYDVTEPARPRLLGRYQADADRIQPDTPPCGPPPGSTAACANGQHSVELVQRADGKVLSLSTEPVAGLLVYESGDVRIVDVTDPTRPVQVGSWPPLGERPPTASVNGCRASNIGHDAGFAAGGTRALVAYGDEGLITLDIRDPARPRRLGQLDYPNVRSVEGNASYVTGGEIGGRSLALVTDEDWFPVTSTVRVDGPTPQNYVACQATFTLFDPQGDAQLYNRPGRQVSGDIVYGGRGCEARPSGATTVAEDPYLADPRGKIVLLDSVRDVRQPGVPAAPGCRHDSKVKRAQLAGALAVILARTASGTDFGFGAGEAGVAIPGDPGAAQHGIDLDIPMVQLDQGDADALRQRLCADAAACASQPRVTGALSDGPGEWGGARVLDVTDPAAPRELAHLLGPGARTFPPPDLGVYSAHHTAFAGTRALVAANADGLRVVDLADPAAPVEVASFVPPDTADPTGQVPARAAVTGVAAMAGYVVITDLNSGLYVLEQTGAGYWLAAADGAVFPVGGAPALSPATSLRLNRPAVGLAATPSGRGYWLVADDGGVFAFGDARFAGSTGALRLNRPVVGMAPTPSGRGYWLVASDGGVFAFGDARFLGSTGALRLNRPVVAMVATPTGAGYWLVAADGGVFAFGDARFLGSTGVLRLAQPVVGAAATPTGRGYWLVASDGGVFAFGDARFAGSTGALRLARPVVAMAPSPTGRGYRLAAADGGIFAFGDSTFLGAAPTTRLSPPVVAMAAVPR